MVTLPVPPKHALVGVANTSNTGAGATVWYASKIQPVAGFKIAIV